MCTLFIFSLMLSLVFSSQSPIHVLCLPSLPSVPSLPSGSLSGGPPRSRAKTFGVFGRESSFKIQNDPDDSSSVVLRPHPLEVQQRRQSKRESWLSDTWDDPLGSSARSFSASLGFEPSSFGKKDHRRFSTALVGQEEEVVGAEL
ncbi:hypothetical protein EMCRGX_G002683 [Ephydatia muelleri]